MDGLSIIDVYDKMDGLIKLTMCSRWRSIHPLWNTSLNTKSIHTSLNLSKMRSGIQKLTTVKIADNSEAAKPYKLTPKCIHVYGRQTANVGDKILITARGEMWKALVLATKVPTPGASPRVRYDGNYVALMNNKNEPIGTRIKIPLPSSIRKHSDNYSKVLALCKKFL